ncbi:hypothetical protein EON63_18665 [archaeon]|nr:MAG: hypothetical protein EON63_18665 [archaeon]
MALNFASIKLLPLEDFPTGMCMCMYYNICTELFVCICWSGLVYWYESVCMLLSIGVCKCSPCIIHPPYTC